MFDYILYYMDIFGNANKGIIKLLSTQWATPLLDGLKREQFKTFGKVVDDLEAALDGDRNIYFPAQV